jgi:peptidyl-prolyl cis-trans isomerase SurA
MFKILIFIYCFINLLGNISFADNDYKILVKVNQKIISNYDIKREIKYLSILNPQIKNISDDEIEKFAKKSLIQEIVKKKETSKYFKNDDQSPDLAGALSSLYTRLNLNSKEEFTNYLEEFDLNLEDVLNKLAIELNWNKMIYQIYKSKVNVNKDKIKKKLEIESKESKIKKMFLISEILFTAKNKEGFDKKYQNIVNSINEKGFKLTATIYSQSDTAKYEGKIGWVSKSDISEQIYQKIYKLKIDEFSEPFKIGAGFLIINLDAVKEEKQKINLDEKFNYIVTKELNRQLNQHSTIHYKKIEKQSFIYEN